MKKVLCPTCGRLSRDEAQFCAHCGNALAVGTNAVAIRVAVRGMARNGLKQVAILFAGLFVLCLILSVFVFIALG